MDESHRSKPGSRPGATTPAKPEPTAEEPLAPAGRIVHDERGNAVWDWVKDTAHIAIDSTSLLLKRLEVPDLKVEEAEEKEPRLESGRDSSGGYDPYGGSSSATRSRPPADPRKATGMARGAGARARSPSDPGGGYDPYGKSVTRKPGR